MNIETVRDYCLSLPLVTEDFPFDDQTLAFRIMDRIFACMDMERPEWVTMKCNPDRALELREEYVEIEGAWHWNKKYWNQVNLYGHLDDELIRSLIRHSYREVVRKLKKVKGLNTPKLQTFVEVLSSLLYQIKQIIRLRLYPKPAVYYMHDSIICPMTDLRL